MRWLSFILHSGAPYPSTNRKACILPNVNGHGRVPVNATSLPVTHPLFSAPFPSSGPSLALTFLSSHRADSVEYLFKGIPIKEFPSFYVPPQPSIWASRDAVYSFENIEAIETSLLPVIDVERIITT